ncbi:MAG: YfcE family phosphodiesterase [Candidatus Bilamarchaeaceae archaeon]
MELQRGKVKIVLIGDFHIPERAEKIPNWIVNTIKDEKVDLILCTGDLTDNSVITKLKSFAPIFCVRGNMDYINLPEREIVKVGNFRILLLHGSGVYPRGNLEQLDKIRKEHEADIVVHGHTHRMSFDILDNGKAIFLNPGTATGVWGGSSESTSQTFILMSIDGNNVHIKFFENEKMRKEVSLCIQKKQ